MIAAEVHSQTQDADHGLTQSWCQGVSLVLIPKADGTASLKGSQRDVTRGLPSKGGKIGDSRGREQRKRTYFYCEEC